MFAQVRHAGRWDPRPDGLSRLSWEIARRTSIETAPAVKAIALADPELFRYPFAVVSSDQAFPAPAENEIAQLRRYLSYGGFLFIDDASGSRGGPFEQSARQLVSGIVPGAQLSRVPREHVLYKSFYLLDGPTGRIASTPDLEGLELGGRLAILYSGNDLIGALARLAGHLGVRGDARRASCSARSRSGSASTWRCTRSASITRRTRFTSRSS